jgi:hypothetical protein
MCCTCAACFVRRYVDRLSSNLQRKAGQEAKMLAAAAETQARQQENRAMLASLQPKVGAGSMQEGLHVRFLLVSAL